jgi:peroxiredoxin
MKRRWNANTWVLAIFCGLMFLTIADVARRYIVGPPVEKAPTRDDIARRLAPSFKVGDVAPDFTAPDAKGFPHRLQDLVKGDTLLCFTCGCSKCLDYQSYMAKLLKKLGPAAPKVINCSTMNKEREQSWHRDTGLDQFVLYSADKQLKEHLDEIYRGHPCPRAFHLSADRRVKWISMAPPLMQDVTDLPNELAIELGFRLSPEDRNIGKPLAPPPPTNLPPGLMADPPLPAAKSKTSA